MNKFVDILSGIGVLIGIYLFISNGDKTVKIIDTVATNSIKGISTLQGR